MKDLIKNATDHFGLIQVPFEIETALSYLQTQKIQSVLEIGTDKGGTFYLWGQLFHGGVKISVDLPYKNYSREERDIKQGNFAVLKDKVKNSHFIQADSHKLDTVMQVLRILKEDKVDLLFIDGDHSFEGAYMDLIMYREFVRKDGLIMFHDIIESDFHNLANCKVYKLWNALRGNKIQITGQHNYGGIGIIRNDELFDIKL